MGELEEPTLETPIPEETPETPTVAELQEKLGQATQKLEQTEKGLRTAHQSLTSKDKQLKRQLDLENTVSTLSQKLDLIARMLDTKGTKRAEDDGFGEVEKETRPDVGNALKDVDSEQKAKVYFNKVNEIQRKALEAGMTDRDLSYWDVAIAAKEGNFQKAELLIDKHIENSHQSRTEQIKAKAKELSERYGVKEEELTKFTDQKDMTIYALEHQTKKPTEQKVKPRYEVATPTSMPKSVWGMSTKEFLAKVEQRKKEAQARKQ